MNEYRTIVVAMDFSENSGVAFNAGVDLANQYGAKLHIVHALVYPVFLVSPYQLEMPRDFLDSARDEAKRKLEAAAEKAGADGVDVEWHFEEGPAAVAIVRVATETDADLVVVGTRGNTGLKHVVLGSVAEQTVRTAPCTVLTVKHG
jgi:nucleotide-binding universal stress UspA family protein